MPILRGKLGPLFRHALFMEPNKNVWTPFTLFNTKLFCTVLLLGSTLVYAIVDVILNQQFAYQLIPAACRYNIIYIYIYCSISVYPIMKIIEILIRIISPFIDTHGPFSHNISHFYPFFNPVLH